MIRCHSEFRDYIVSEIAKNDSQDGGLDVHQLFNRYTMGVIANAVFGVDGKTFQVRVVFLFMSRDKFTSRSFLFSLRTLTLCPTPRS